MKVDNGWRQESDQSTWPVEDPWVIEQWLRGNLRVAP